MISLDPIRPYLGIAKVVAVLAACVFMYARGHSNGVDAERGKWNVQVSEARKARIEDYELKLAKAATDNVKTAKEAESAKAKAEASEKHYADLLARIPTKPLVTHELAKPGEACPPAPRLSPDFRLRFNEAVIGPGPSDR